MIPTILSAAQKAKHIGLLSHVLQKELNKPKQNNSFIHQLATDITTLNKEIILLNQSTYKYLKRAA